MELNYNSGGEGRGQLDLATGVGTDHRLYQKRVNSVSPQAVTHKQQVPDL